MYQQTYEKLPRHVAVIMDGNGRWAKKRGLPRTLGHRAGVEALREIVRMSSDVGIQILTVYAFSTENWKRPKDEVSGIFRLLIEYLNREVAEMVRNNVRIHAIGAVEGLPKLLRDAIAAAEKDSSGCTGMVFNVALNYGGRAELVRAVQSLAEDAASGRINPADISEDMISGRLYTSGQADPDLVIRTGGERRLSNFLLFQSSYAELVFPDTLWPDFTPDEYDKALREYASRHRRFGDVGTKEA